MTRLPESQTRLSASIRDVVEADPLPFRASRCVAVMCLTDAFAVRIFDMFFKKR